LVGRQTPMPFLRPKVKPPAAVRESKTAGKISFPGGF